VYREGLDCTVALYYPYSSLTSCRGAGRHRKIGARDWYIHYGQQSGTGWVIDRTYVNELGYKRTKILHDCYTLTIVLVYSY
jgi:hypothetical protein